MTQKRARIFIFFATFWITWNYETVRCEESLIVSTTGPLPKFITKTGKYRAVTGDTVILPCRVENLAPYILLWKRGNAVLSAGDMKITIDPRIQLVDGFNLEIKKVRLLDGGDYICQMSTLTPEDQIHTLEILVPPTVRIEPKSDLVTVSKGDTVTLQCKGTGNPIPSIRWTRKNNLLPNGEQSVEGNSFSIQKADRHQAGIYVCSASNGVGNPESAAIQVKVQYPPEIEVERSWIHAGEGVETELVCIVHSDPTAAVWWYRETMTLDTSDRRLFEEHGARRSLIIRKVQVGDFGNYSCVADNKLGRSKKHMELSGKPNQPIFRSDPSGRYRESYNITWVVESYSVITEYRLLYRKTDGNNTLDKASEWSDVVLPATDYIFHSGNSQPLPKTVSSSIASSSALIVHVKSYHIRNLESETSYEAIVSAKNKFGVSQKSESFVFHTRKTDLHPFESSPQHDVLADPEIRDLGITAASSPATSVHPSPATFLTKIVTSLSLSSAANAATTFLANPITLRLFRQT